LGQAPGDEPNWLSERANKTYKPNFARRGSPFV
jgi:hypothetical protein